ncbi:MAG: hypothetical protein OXO56_04800 [Gammaproteobacteria bacterium]|nr:hypothetical protein [Gammaproteobacteria bacterium]
MSDMPLRLRIICDQVSYDEAELGAYGAVGPVANLGGYRASKHDPDPGDQIMWHGSRHA